MRSLPQGVTSCPQHRISAGLIVIPGTSTMLLIAEVESAQPPQVVQKCGPFSVPRAQAQ